MITSGLTILSYLPLFAFVAVKLSSAAIIGVTVVFLVFQLLGTSLSEFKRKLCSSRLHSDRALHWLLRLLVDADEGDLQPPADLQARRVNLTHLARGLVAASHHPRYRRHAILPLTK
jgi:hypothetical protein